jgi:muramoyltetrapeptide carboxypeptidase
MIVPAYLKKGDTILIIATARARNKEALKPAIAILQNWGLVVETGPNVFNVHFQFAGTDAERADDLQWAIDHPTAKAVLIAGGGYGTLRIISEVDVLNLKKFPKWFVGYSDTTVIHALLADLEIASIHGTMGFQFTKHEEATLSVKKLLFGEAIHYTIEPHVLNRTGIAEGELVGGNLSLIYALSGSMEDLDTRDKILFLEDLDEQLYHIDRMMLQLQRSTKLSQLKGLIIGGMSDMKDNAIPFGKTAEEIIMDAVRHYEYPVCFNFPAGHIENNMALYFGKKAKLEVRKNKTVLKYL